MTLLNVCENMTKADGLKPTHCTFNIKTGTWHWPLIKKKKDKILLNSHQSGYIYRINHDITLYQQLTSNCLVFPLLKRVCFEAGVSRASQKNSFISFSFRPSAHLCVSSSFRWGQPQKAEVFVRFEKVLSSSSASPERAEDAVTAEWSQICLV